MFTCIHYSQTNLDKIKHAYDIELAKYFCGEDDKVKIMCDSLFNDQVESIFNTVVLNNSDIITNGSAIAFAQDKDKGTFSFNTTVRLPKSFYLDLGLSYENKENFSLNLYSNQALTNDLGLKIGLLYKVKATQFIKGTPCVTTNNARDNFMRFVKLNEYNLIFNTTIDELQGKLEKEYQTEATTELELKTKTENIKTLSSKIKKLNDLQTKLDNDEYQSIAKKDFYAYDNENVTFTGYSMGWLNINGNFKNSRLGEKYIIIDESQAVKRNDDVFKMNLELSYNYFKDNNYVFYIQGFTRLNRGSFLDSPVYRLEKEFTLVQNSVPSQYDVALDGQAILPYDYLERPYLEGQIGGQLLLLFPKKKSVGFTTRVSYNFPIGSQLLVPYTNNYNLLIGPTFRSNDSKDTTLKLSKSTITLLCGFEQVPFNTNAWDLFIVKASIGIPLTLFIKKQS
jgi:hypothetical protein